MKTEKVALVRAVLESPFDDAPRLVYADWLEENGRPGRAEFIRAQVELARGPAPGEALYLPAAAHVEARPPRRFPARWSAIPIHRVPGCQLRETGNSSHLDGSASLGYQIS